MLIKTDFSFPKHVQNSCLSIVGRHVAVWLAVATDKPVTKWQVLDQILCVWIRKDRQAVAMLRRRYTSIAEEPEAEEDSGDSGKVLINVKFPPQPQHKYYITQYEEFGYS